MKLVVIESPYAGATAEDIDTNVRYARACIKDALLKGEAPIASHLLYTQPGILRDEVSEERTLGIEAGLAWAKQGEVSAFYIDRGWSRGMIAAFRRARSQGRRCELRTLGGVWCVNPPPDADPHWRSALTAYAYVHEENYRSVRLVAEEDGA